MISFLTNKEIDYLKWDRCVENSNNTLIYAMSWYLDVVSPNWSALVLDDYAAVMPLCSKTKMGLPHIADPLYAQQLGLFGSDKPNLYNDFLHAIPKKFIKVRMQINPRGLDSLVDGLNERSNHILDINEGFQSSYNQNTKRNIKKFNEQALKIEHELTASDFVAFKKSRSAVILDDKDWELMEQLIATLLERKSGFFRAVYDEGSLISAVFFAHWKERLYYLFSASNELGKDKSCAFGIIDQVLSKSITQFKLLDFEGSMNPNIARFFKGFGAKEEPYYEYNRWFFQNK